MKLKPTPLFLVGAGLILYGLYMYFFVDPGEEGWGTLIAMMIVGAGIVCLFVYAILLAIFRTKVWTQVFIEAVLIMGVFYFWYKKTGKYEFVLPHNYRGYVIVVYGVDHAPKLKTPLYSNKIKVKVPPSGIILTSSLRNDNYGDPAVFLDSTLGDINELPAPFNKQNIGPSSDTLKCKGRKYLCETWLIKSTSNWSAVEDTINRLDLKLFEACVMIKQ